MKRASLIAALAFALLACAACLDITPYPVVEQDAGAGGIDDEASATDAGGDGG